MQTVIYNVVIGGVSVGMTFSITEAENWVKRTMFKGEKKIYPVAYNATIQ